ncbi:MAG TPA: hypothetical protein VJC11_00110 [Patescibacteria group bacterium]|nr:hypothetical protein [Patescibacteria group bacterium]
MKIFIFGVMAAVFFSNAFLMPSAVFACSCVADIPQKDSFDQAKAVFSGKVLSIHAKEGFFGVDFSRREVTIQVLETWKGTSTNVVTVATGRDDGDCGFAFQKGERYLVYAHDASRDYQTELGTGICERTKLLAQADEDLATLGSGKTFPEEPIGSLPTEHSTDNAFWIAAFLILALVIFLYILTRRFIRK